MAPQEPGFAAHGRSPLLQLLQGLLTMCEALPVLWGKTPPCQQYESLLFLLYGLDRRDNGPMPDLSSNHPTHEDPRMPFDLVSHGL
jgi:hypothetical protein